MEVNYQEIWQNKWGDMQKYGPSHRHIRRITKKLLRDLKFKSLLDIGCGEGSNLLYLKSLNNNIKVSGVDISAEAVRQAKKSIPEGEFFVLDCQRQRLVKQFDLVFCSHVLEHLVEDLSAIKNIYAMTGKYFLVSSLQGKMREFEKNIGHVRNYQSGELEDKLSQAGFKIIKKVEWGWPLFSLLYRSILNAPGLEKRTGGQYGIMKKIIAQVLYWLFFISSSKKGDVIFILAAK